MQYRQLGHTDLSVSALCLGVMTFGEQNTEQQAHEQLDVTYEGPATLRRPSRRHTMNEGKRHCK